MTRPHRAAATTAALASLALGGCAERGLVAQPTTAPDALTWGVVWTAALLATLVIGVLLTLPAWQARSGARAAVAVLSVQAGAVVVAGTVLLGVAVRTWQLIERPVEAAPAQSLLRLSRIDGDTALMALFVLLVTVVAGLAAGLTAVAARFAASDDVLERSTACALLALELGACAFAVVRLLTGAEGWTYITGTVAFPVVAVAFGACWPVSAPAPPTAR